MSDPRLQPIVNEIQKDLASLMALVVSPGPVPPPKPQFAITAAGLVVLWRVLLTVAVVIHSLLHLAPAPAPKPVPDPPVPPAPAPPVPGPVPPAPARVTARLYCIQVFNPQAIDVATLDAVAVAGDSSTETGLKALDVEWRHWDVAEPMLDSLKLRAFLPDPARLPVLLVYDATGTFYDLSGTKLDRSRPVFQKPPAQSSALVAAFKALRSR